MATHTSIGSGLWSAAGTWDASGVPVNNGVVVIASGHTVEFDVDQSGFADGIDGLTITGTLKLTTTTGTYQLKMKAAKTITGAGTFQCGSSITPIPFAAKHTITGGSGWYITGASGLTMTVYAAEPTIKTVLLTGTEAIGDTVMNVDTDVTGDIWAAGDIVRIDDINRAVESEERTIAGGGIAAGTITITAGLTAAKSATAMVHLMSRNVKFIGVGAHLLQGFTTAGKLTVAGGEFTVPSYSIFRFGYNVISGGTFRGSAHSCYGMTSTISGGVFSAAQLYAMQPATTISGGSFSGAATLMDFGTGVSISGGTWKGANNALADLFACSISGGTFSQCGYGVYACNAMTITGGTFSLNTYGIGGNCSISVLKNASFNNVTADVYSVLFTAYNCLFSATLENSTYTGLARESYSESNDHDQVTGAFKAWTVGGVSTKQATTYPTGYTTSMQTVLENATSEGFYQKTFVVGAGASINFDLWLRKSASMTYLPRIIFFDRSAADPFAGGAGVHTFTMTNSVDTWENETYIYTNSGSNDVTIVARVLGMNATGNVFSSIKGTQINVDLTILTANVAVIDTVVDGIATSVDELAAVVGNIATTGAAAYSSADSFTKTTGGAETGTYANTDTTNSVYHQIADSAGTLNVYYQYNLRPDEVAVGVTFKGRMMSAGDNAAVQAYDWVGAAWVTLFSLTGTATTTDTTSSPALVAKYTGTGANVGIVRIRVYGTGLTSANLYVDQCIVSKASTSRTVGYTDGAVWINTGITNTNTVLYNDGVADNPVSTYAAAKTIASALGLKRFRITNGSTLTLTSTAANYSHIGKNWSLALNGQAIDGAYFESANVSGTGTNTTQAQFAECSIAAGTTTGPALMLRCGFEGTSLSPYTAGSAGDFLFVDCYSEVAGSGTPYFTFSGACGVNIRRWSGGSNITLNNALSTLTMEVVTGGGQTIATAGANVEIRGICRAITLNGIASGSVCQVNAITGPIALAGADGTVRIYGVCGVVTDSRTGTPTLTNAAVSSEDIGEILIKTDDNSALILSK